MPSLAVICCSFYYYFVAVLLYTQQMGEKDEGKKAVNGNKHRLLFLDCCSKLDACQCAEHSNLLAIIFFSHTGLLIADAVSCYFVAVCGCEKMMMTVREDELDLG
jgi:hypothetical protein